MEVLLENTIIFFVWGFVSYFIDENYNNIQFLVVTLSPVAAMNMLGLLTSIQVLM